MPVLDSDTLALGLTWYVVFVFSTVLHEAAHAVVAHLGGDDTAARGGQAGLDPLPHVRREPIGMILVPWATFLLNGWMMGWASAPYDPMWAEEHPRRAARMALAGPVANFLLALAAGIAMRTGLAHGWLTPMVPNPDHDIYARVVLNRVGEASALSMLLSVTFTLNLVLGAFNLLPVPPLDGSGAIGLLMPEDVARRWQAAVHSPQFNAFGLLIGVVMFYYIGGRVFELGLALLYR